MAQISASDVSKLRKATGAGMMDCKKALQETEGDFDKAVELIRKKGQAIANKRADRETNEGAVLAKVNNGATAGAVIALTCETDFVAKNNDFVALTQSVLDLALEKLPTSTEELKELNLNGKKVSEVIVEQIGVIGEKIEISYYEKLEAGSVIPYIHPGNKLATIVGFNKTVEEQVGKDVAMQVAAMAPIAVDKDTVPADVIEKEKEIGREQAAREGKPEKILDKIAEGKVNKFLKESTLLNQEFIKESKKSVKAYLAEQDKELTVTEFKRFSIQ